MTVPAVPVPPPPRRPGASWLLVPLVLWLVSLALVAVGGLGLYRSLAPDLSLVDPGDRVRVTGSGVAVWQDAGAGIGDPGCSLERAAATVRLEGGPGTLSADGLDLVLVGTAPDVSSGTWTLVCEDEEAALYVTREPAVLLGVLTTVASLLLFLGSVVLATVLVVRRRRSGRPSRPATASPPATPGWGPGIPS